VRGAGLLLAAQLDAPLAREVSARALARGLLVNAVRADAVRLAPPLLVGDDEVEQALAVLGEVLGDLVGDLPAETVQGHPPGPGAVLRRAGEVS
jgi:acetylornithine/N-succinyldiaminopimelate aminotransferase